METPTALLTGPSRSPHPGTLYTSPRFSSHLSWKADCRVRCALLSGSTAAARPQVSFRYIGEKPVSDDSIFPNHQAKLPFHYCRALDVYYGVFPVVPPAQYFTLAPPALPDFPVRAVSGHCTPARPFPGARSGHCILPTDLVQVPVFIPYFLHRALSAL